MFLFQEDRPADCLREKKLQLLKHLLWWNTDYSVAFDEQDRLYRDELLRQAINSCWIGAGLLGISGWNFRYLLRQGAVTPKTAWILATSIFGTVGLATSRVYFTLKIEALDYVTSKYLLPARAQQPLQK